MDPEQGALEYEFQVLDEDGDIVQSVLGVTPLDAGAASVSWTVPEALEKGARFTWEVRAVDPLGLAGDWSAPASFEVYEEAGGGGGGGCGVGGLRCRGTASIFTIVGALLPSGSGAAAAGILKRGARALLGASVQERTPHEHSNRSDHGIEAVRR